MLQYNRPFDCRASTAQWQLLFPRKLNRLCQHARHELHNLYIQKSNSNFKKSRLSNRVAVRNWSSLEYWTITQKYHLLVVLLWHNDKTEVTPNGAVATNLRLIHCASNVSITDSAKFFFFSRGRLSSIRKMLVTARNIWSSPSLRVLRETQTFGPIKLH